jgi:lipoyl-dependent peroxiredoxin
MEKFSTVVWKGGLKEGQGKISSESGALKEVPFSFQTRFEDQPGSNPEELIGAALAACYSMALAHELEKIDFTPEKIHTSASVKLVKQTAGFEITDIYLSTQAIVPNLDEGTFKQAAELTKKTCPVAKLLNASIHLEAHVSQHEERIAG